MYKTSVSPGLEQQNVPLSLLAYARNNLNCHVLGIRQV